MSEHDFDGVTADEKLAARKRAEAAAAERGETVTTDEAPAEPTPARTRRQTTREA